MTTIKPDVPDPSANRSVLAIALVLILATLGVYWNSFGVPFLLDDRLSINDNSSIRNLGRIADVLWPPGTTTTAGRPLLNLSFALNYAVGGLSLRGYHVVNLLVHICSGLVFFGIVRRTLFRPNLSDRYGADALPLAAFAALIWTLHPVQTESVTYISQRAESMMGLFFLLTLYCFIRSTLSESRAPWLWASLASCICGMATKEVIATVPLIVLLYDRAFVSESFRAALTSRRWYYAGLAATWPLLGFAMSRSGLGLKNVGVNSMVSWWIYALSELPVVVSYVKLSFWPHPLVFDYGREMMTIDPAEVVPCGLLVAALLAAVAIAWRKSPKAGFLGCWFFVILSPTSTVVPIGDQAMAESRLYLPLAAVAVLVTLLCHRLCGRRAFAALGIMAVALGAATVARNHDYRSELSIWQDTIDKQPGSSRGHYSLAAELAKTPETLPDAIVHYEISLRMQPNQVKNYDALGMALAQTPGRLSDAIAHFEAALRIQPDFAEAHNNLAMALEKMPGRLPDAIAHYEKALSSRPDFAEAHSNFANALSEIPGRLPDVIAHYQEALRLKPDFAEAHNNLGNALCKEPGRLPDAIAHYQEALRLKPDFAEAHYNFARALSKLPGRLPDATAHYQEAIRIKPDFIDAYNNLAEIYAKSGRFDAAIEQLEIAIRHNPEAGFIRENLERLKAMRNR
jgi:tetratricopeptide (TPR) repeat protein